LQKRAREMLPTCARIAPKKLALQLRQDAVRCAEKHPFFACAITWGLQRKVVGQKVALGALTPCLAACFGSSAFALRPNFES
jgi:hypothetical protein